MGSFVLETAKDFFRGGPSFFLTGVMTAIGGKRERRVRLKNAGQVVIRPKDSDFKTFRQVFRDSDYALDSEAAERRVETAYKAMLDAGEIPVIVDAGANIGAATRWFARKFDKAAIVAIEPDPENARILRLNTGDLPRARVMEAAVGGEPGFVAMTNIGESWAVATVREASGLPIVTIADALATIPGGKLFIVKIDIEGFESDLFAGDTAWLDEPCVVYIEPHDWLLPGQRSSRSFQRVFGERDFEIFVKGENLAYVR
jgi:FkbM family methyltransferase